MESDYISDVNRTEAKEKTRDALLLAALESFAEQGLERPSLDAICARAGRTRGAFYVHFESREQLVAAVVERVLREYLGALAVLPADLHSIVDAFADLLRSAEASPSPFLRLGTRHFHLLLDAGSRYPTARTQLDASLAAGAGLLTDRLGDANLAETLTTLLIGLLAFRPKDGGTRIDRVQHTLRSLL